MAFFQSSFRGGASILRHWWQTPELDPVDLDVGAGSEPLSAFAQSRILST